MKPIAGTDLCRSSHHAYQITGRLRVVMADGSEFEVGPGEVGVIPPGHDAWVVGNEAVTGIEIGPAWRLTPESSVIDIPSRCG